MKRKQTGWAAELEDGTMFRSCFDCAEVDILAAEPVDMFGNELFAIYGTFTCDNCDN